MGLEGPKQGLGCSRCAPGCQLVSAGVFVLTSLLSLHELGTAAGASSISASVEEDFSLPCSHQETLGKVLVPWHGHPSSLDRSPWPVASRGDDSSSCDWPRGGWGSPEWGGLDTLTRGSWVWSSLSHVLLLNDPGLVLLLMTSHVRVCSFTSTVRSPVLTHFQVLGSVLRCAWDFSFLWKASVFAFRQKAKSRFLIESWVPKDVLVVAIKDTCSVFLILAFKLMLLNF